MRDQVASAFCVVYGKKAHFMKLKSYEKLLGTRHLTKKLASIKQ
jgi:hypothetical protein